MGKQAMTVLKDDPHRMAMEAANTIAKITSVLRIAAGDEESGSSEFMPADGPMTKISISGLCLQMAHILWRESCQESARQQAMEQAAQNPVAEPGLQVITTLGGLVGAIERSRDLYRAAAPARDKPQENQDAPQNGKEDSEAV